MRRRPIAGRCHVDLARIGFGIGDKLRNGPDRDRWMHLHEIRCARNGSDRCNVTDKIEIEISIERRIDDIRRAGQEKRIAIGGARMTASVAMLVPAPGRFSMMNCWPRRSVSHWPIRRAVMSTDPPGGKPTTIRTGRVG